MMLVSFEHFVIKTRPAADFYGYTVIELQIFIEWEFILIIHFDMPIKYISHQLIYILSIH